MTVTSTTGAPATSPYVMGRTQAEQGRLDRQAAMLAPFTAALLDRVGVPAGARCLDVGCGTGGVMALLAQRAGFDGHVTGVDVDGPLGEVAMTALREAGHQQTRFVAGNVLDVSLEAAAFDIVYARLVLIHADDPLAVLRRMWQLTAPGGALVVQDYDLRPAASEPPTWALDEFQRVFCGTLSAHGRPLDAGLRLPRWFREAGIGAPEGTSIDGILTTIDDLRWQLEAAYRSALPLAIEDGLTTVADSDAWFAELAAMAPDQTILHPLLCSAFARKPRP